MNPSERLLATLRGDVADRVPLILQGFHYETVDDVEDETKREIVERILDETHFEARCPSFINRYLVTPPHRVREVSREERNGYVTIRSEVDTPRGKLTDVVSQNPTSRTTWTVKYPVESLEDIERIRSIPWELPGELAPPDANRRPASFAARGISRTGVSSPFVCVAGMMPFDFFLELCAREFNLVKELTAQCLERILDVLDVLLSENSIDLVWMGGCEWLTPPMGSPQHYQALVQDIETVVIDRIHAGGALSHVHCHGNVRSTLELVIERGADFFEPVEPPPDGDISFAEAKALAKDRITLGGNVEARVLEHGTAEAVEHATRQAFQGGKHRTVLQPSADPVCALTPRMAENYHRLIDVWEELSTIETDHVSDD